MNQGCWRIDKATGRGRSFMLHQFDKASGRCECGRWAPGRKPAVSNEEAGRCECQVCEHFQKTNRRGHLVLHGYERPGYGWIVGKCYGTDAAPFPATDRLEAWGTAVRNGIPGAEARVADLKAGNVEELTVVVQLFKLDFEGGHKIVNRSTGYTRMENARQIVRKGDAARIVEQPYQDYRNRPEINKVEVESYADALPKEIARAENNVAQMKYELKRIEKRIALGRKLRAEAAGKEGAV